MAALEMFAGKTYHNTSISDIAKAAGISKGLIYNYFETKEDILKGLIDYIMGLGEALFAKAEGLGNPKAELKAIIDMVFDFLEQQEKLTRMMIPLALEVGNFEYVNTLVEGKFAGYLHKLVDILARLGFADPENEAWTLGILFDGLSLDYAVIGEKLPRENIRRYLYTKYTL